MRLISWNVNGIRAVLGKGLAEQMAEWQADIVCLQETKARENQVDGSLWEKLGYYHHWSEAEKAGYSGVVTFSKKKPDKVWRLGNEDFDKEGRVIGVDFPGMSVVNAYFPNSQDAGARLDYKLAFCRALEEKLENLRTQGREILLCGDYNIAHQPIDLARPKENVGNPGYLPEERAWMEHFLGLGWVDTFRSLHPDTVQYSWWSYRFQARQKNIGWRIDYHCVTPKLGKLIKSAEIYEKITGSDHCPVSVDIDIDTLR